MSYYNTPDLASILHTLSTYTPAPQPELPVVGYPPQQQAPPPLEDGELPFEPPYEPAEIPYEPQAITAHEQPVATPLSYEPRQPQPSALPTHQLQSQLPPPYQPTHQQPLIPSASTITSWPSALRHVTMHLAHNEEVMFRIKRLISAQHDHERQWWAQREALLKTQRGRDEERRKLDGVLSAVGGHIAPITHVHDPTSEKAELDRFDKKVYIACREMVASTAAELDRLGVPFFRLQKALVVDNGGKEEGKIDVEELGRLRTKIVGLLEDLCKD